MLTLARILLTFTVLGYGFATIKVDLNKTHATNPTWTPHARFHVVWQILSYTGIGLISLYLIWIAGGTSIQPLYLAVAISVAIYAGFFTAVFARPCRGQDHRLRHKEFAGRNAFGAVAAIGCV